MKNKKNKNSNTTENTTTDASIVINKINLYNFKSFQGNHEIGFFKRFTSVLGANGSGKSNILDAISFVCGINSRFLRSENMKKLVNRNSLSPSVNSDKSVKSKDSVICFVELSLTLSDASNKKEELLLQRKIFDSKTECFINNKKYSTEEYLSFLHDHRVSLFAKHFIIYQNSIDTLMSSRFELTDIIEGLSGSGEHKSLYNSLQKDTENTQDGILDLQKQILFIKESLKELRSLSNNDEKFIEINKLLNEILIEIFLYKLLEQDKTVETNKNSLVDVLKTHEDMLIKKQEILSLLQQEKSLLREYEETSQYSKEKEYIKIKNDILEKTSLYKILESRINNLESQIMSKISVLQHNNKDTKDSILYHEKQKSNFIKQKEELKLLISKSFGFEKMSEEELYAFTKLKDDFEEYAKETLLSKKRLDKEYVELEKEVFENTKKISTLNNEKDNIIVTIKSDEEQQKHYQKLLKDQENKKQQKNQFLKDQNTQKIDLLNKMEKESVLYQENTVMIDKYKNLVGLTDKRKKIKELMLSGILGFFNELVSPINKKYDLAVKVSLNKYLNYLVVKDYDTAKKCLRFFDDNDISQDVLILSEVPETSTNDNISLSEGCSMTYLINTKNQEIKKAVFYFLRNVFFCHDKSNTKKLQDKGIRNLIFEDGTTIKKGVFSGGTYKNLLNFDIESMEIDKKIKEQKMLGEKIENYQEKIKDLEFTMKKEEDFLKEYEVNAFLWTQKKESLEKNIFINTKKTEEIQKEIDTYQTNKTKTSLHKEKVEKEKEKLEKEIENLKNSFYKKYSSQRKNQITINDISTKDLEILNKEAVILEEKINSCDNEINKLKDHDIMVEKLKNNLEEDKKQKSLLNKEKEDVKEKLVLLKKEYEHIEYDVVQQKKQLENLQNKVFSYEKDLSLTEQRIRSLYKNRLDHQYAILQAIKSKTKLLEDFKINLSSYLEKFTFSVVGNYSLKVTDYITDKETFSFDDPIIDALTEDTTIKAIKQETWYVIDYSSLPKISKTAQSAAATVEKLEKEFQNRLHQKDEIASLKLKAAHDDEETLKAKENDLLLQKKDLETQISEMLKNSEKMKKEFSTIQKTRKTLFSDYLDKISSMISDVYGDFYSNELMTTQGAARIYNTNPQEPYNGTTVYLAFPPGKRKTSNLVSLSGGEKTIAIVALIFALSRISNIPFIVFDEIDTYLDKKHEEILENKILENSQRCQIITVTHKPSISRSSGAIIGTYYNKKEESSVVISVDMENMNIK